MMIVMAQFLLGVIILCCFTGINYLLYLFGSSMTGNKTKNPSSVFYNWFLGLMSSLFIIGILNFIRFVGEMFLKLIGA